MDGRCMVYGKYTAHVNFPPLGIVYPIKTSIVSHFLHVYVCGICVCVYTCGFLCMCVGACVCQCAYTYVQIGGGLFSYLIH